MSPSYPKTYPILSLRKTARRGNCIPRRALQSRDGRIRTGDPLNPIQVAGRTRYERDNQLDVLLVDDLRARALRLWIDSGR